jgi:hypothetical protein
MQGMRGQERSKDRKKLDTFAYTLCYIFKFAIVKVI